MNERYRLVRPLAVGGMAELFLGVSRSEGFERAVAIKRMLPQLAQEPDIARMFLAEARLATQLQHQNIATVYDVGQGPGGLFLVMELVDGWDLGVLLRAAARHGVRFPPHLAAFVLLQVLAGLSHAYRKLHGGRPLLVAHRDVSPSNVLVSREGEVKVTDFGIARMAGTSFTEPGVFKGKAAYSAPEVIQGAPATAASDQFSLGIVFHELLTGRHPFDAELEPISAMQAILSREVTRPPEVPAPLADVVMRMLARAPEERFPTPEALAEALARWLAQAGEPATSHTLAAFMRELALPPTLRELAEAADAQPVAPSPPAFVPEQEQEEAPLPGGAALSASGRVVHRCTRCGHPLSAPRAPCDHCAAELAPPSPNFAPGPDSGIATPSRGGFSGTMLMGSAPAPATPRDSAPEWAARTVASATPPRAASAPAGTPHAPASSTPPRAAPSGASSSLPMGPSPLASSAPLRASTSMPMPRSGDPAWTAHAPAASTPPRSTLGAGAPLPPAPAFAAQPPLASGPWHSPSGERSPTLSLADSLESAPSSARSVFQTPAEALELAERTPRAESDWHEDTLAARGRGRRRFFKALGLMAVLAGGAALWHWRGTVSRELLATTGIRLPAPGLTIQSQPSGATVSVEGKDVGTTPLSVDNLYPDQVLSVQVRLKGYRTWKGTFRGGQPVELQVTLEP